MKLKNLYFSEFLIDKNNIFNEIEEKTLKEYVDDKLESLNENKDIAEKQLKIIKEDYSFLKLASVLLLSIATTSFIIFNPFNLLSFLPSFLYSIFFLISLSFFTFSAISFLVKDHVYDNNRDFLLDVEDNLSYEKMMHKTKPESLIKITNEKEVMDNYNRKDINLFTLSHIIHYIDSKKVKNEIQKLNT
jgi:hypothetical protein